MDKYFYSKNSSTNETLIDDTYQNLCLSRKIQASTLPIVTVSESGGYVMKGSIQLREITLNNNELIVAVGGYKDRRCPYFIWNCLKSTGQEYEIKRFLCAASTVNGRFKRANTSIYSGSDIDNEDTNLSSTYAPNDLYIYTFSNINNSNQEKLGFQVFNASGDIVFDSTNKYFNILEDNGNVAVSRVLPNDRALAVAIIDPFVDSYRGSYIAGQVLFESGWQSRVSGYSPYATCHLGMGIRQLYQGTASVNLGYISSSISPNYMLIDVEGF